MNNKINKRNDKGLFTAIAITLLLVLCLPLLYVEAELKKKVIIHENDLLTTAKANLVQEITDFQYDLEPAKYIEKAMSVIISDNILDPEHYSPTEFGMKCKSLLTKDFGIKPIILVCSNKDFSTLFTDFSQYFNQVIDDIENYKYMLALFPIFSYPDTIDQVLSLPNIRKNKYLFETLTTISSKGNDKSKEDLTSEEIKKLGKLSLDLPTNDSCRCYYTEIFQNQRLYLYAYHITFNKKFYGTILMGTVEMDITPEQIMQSALKKQLLNKAKRAFGKELLQIDNNKISILAYPPSSFINLIYTKNRNTKQTNIKINSKNKIGIILNKSFLNSDLNRFVYITRFTINICVLFVFFIWIRGILFGTQLPITLRTKFLLIIILVALLPSFFIGMFSFFTYRQIDSYHLNKAEAIIDHKLNEIERLVYESKIRQTLLNLSLKDKLQNELNNHSLDALKHIPLNKDLMVYGERFFLIDKYGNERRPKDDPISHPVSIFNGITILDYLEVLDKTYPEARKKFKRTQMTKGFAGGFLNLLKDPNLFTSESEISRSPTHMNSFSKGIFQLYIDKQQPPQVCAISFKELRIDKFLKELIQKLKHYHKAFQINEDGLMGSAYITSVNIDLSQAKLLIDFKQKNSNILDLASRMALKSQVSGNSIKINETSKDFFEWRYKSDSKFILGANVKVEREKYMHSIFIFVPAIFGTFSLLMLLILTEIMAELFTSPINALSKGSHKIKNKNNLLTKVSINTGDELEEMGSIFNSMTTSLQERKNMTRFVSNKLVSILEKEQLVKDKIGETTQVTILTSDIRSFTSITETYPPEAVVLLLNEYFTCMEAAIVKHGGIIDKFIGDAVIAIFYSDEDSHYTLNACKAGISIREELRQLNIRRKSDNLFTIDNGVGIASGKVISGNIGVSDSYMEFSITGKPLSRASILEASSKEGKFTKIILDKASMKTVRTCYNFNKLCIEKDFIGYEIKSKI